MCAIRPDLQADQLPDQPRGNRTRVRGRWIKKLEREFHRRTCPRRESSLYVCGWLDSYFVNMIAAPLYTTRRATVEDLPQLIPLWRLEQLSAPSLEKRFTEFQVVSDDAGQVLAAIGFQVSGSDGWLHSESIARPENADQLRELLWNRLQVIIHNFALERLWTQLDFPFWRNKGFARTTTEQLSSLPNSLREHEGPWQLMTLRAADAKTVIDREFTQLKTLQQQESARLQHQVLWMKRIALSVTVVVFLLVVVWAVVLLKVGPKIFRAH